MHRARIKRHGHPSLKEGPHALEKLPHAIVDDFIRKNCKKLFDWQIVKILKKKGVKEATVCRVKYRRRRLGVKKYLYGEIKKHKAWIRVQAIKKYGAKCEICGYKLVVDTHHIIPKNKGGLHETDNLIVLCPNCHALITRRLVLLKNRKDITSIRKTIKSLKHS